jgi:Tfp pilus assembly PilM family ATPase
MFFGCQREYFEFDEVDHYVTSISEDRIVRLNDVEQTDSDKHLSDLLFEENLPTLDKDFETKLKRAYNLESTANENQKTQINEIYKSKVLPRISETKCLPVFRDILIFKKNDRITGVSKICFDCNMDFTIDSLGNLGELDTDGFNKLKEILK